MVESGNNLGNGSSAMWSIRSRCVPVLQLVMIRLSVVKFWFMSHSEIKSVKSTFTAACCFCPHQRRTYPVVVERENSVGPVIFLMASRGRLICLQKTVRLCWGLWENYPTSSLNFNLTIQSSGEFIGWGGSFRSYSIKKKNLVSLINYGSHWCEKMTLLHSLHTPSTLNLS